jgi:hypothetical protein
VAMAMAETLAVVVRHVVLGLALLVCMDRACDCGWVHGSGHVRERVAPGGLEVERGDRAGVTVTHVLALRVVRMMDRSLRD